jgi:hypothetical protein
MSSNVLEENAASIVRGEELLIFERVNHKNSL